MTPSGHTVLVVGGTSGIGLGLALRFLAADNAVIIAGRRRDLLDRLVAEHPGLQALEVDVSDPASILALRDTVEREHPDVDVVVSMAGIMLAEDLLDPASLPTAEETVTVNLLGTIRLVHAFLPMLLRRDEAVVMTVSSGLAFVPLAVTPTYSATKAAVHSFTESLRAQLRATPVQVIELVPPGVRTTLFGQEAAGQGMPLEDFLDETVQLLLADDAIREVCVQDVAYLREAERSGEYDAAFAALNPS